MESRWICQYCQTSNLLEELKCRNCGAPLKIVPDPTDPKESLELYKQKVKAYFRTRFIFEDTPSHGHRNRD